MCERRNAIAMSMDNCGRCAFSERDIRRPEALKTNDEKGEFRVMVKKENRISEFVVDHHPSTLWAGTVITTHGF